MSSDTFAATHQRIIARREAQRRAAQAALQNTQPPPSHIYNRVPGRLRPLVANTSQRLNNFWSILTQSRGTSPSFRVTQIDAELLDTELLTLLQSQFTQALKYFPSPWQDTYTREIDLILKFALFKLSFWNHNASYGATLQGLEYTHARTSLKPTRTQKTLYGLITVLGNYLYHKTEDHLLEAEASFEGPSSFQSTISSVLTKFSTVHTLASFVSFCVFLVNGRYRTLTDRILRLRLTPTQSQTRRELSFEYLNRQLVWHAFTEFLLFLLPLVGISRWRRWISRAWKRATKALMRVNEDENTSIRDRGPLDHLPERTCAVCYADSQPQQGEEVLGANIAVIGSVETDVVNPYEGACGCIYCFVCLAQKIESGEGDGWTCLRCGETITSCRPWHGDVLVQEMKEQKSVEFVDEKEKQVHSDLGSSQWQMEEENG